MVNVKIFFMRREIHKRSSYANETYTRYADVAVEIIDESAVFL